MSEAKKIYSILRRDSMFILLFFVMIKMEISILIIVFIFELILPLV